MEEMTALAKLVEMVKETDLPDLEPMLFENFEIGSPLEDDFTMLMQEVMQGVMPVTLASVSYGLTWKEAFWLMIGLCYGGLMEFNMSMLHFKGQIFRDVKRKGEEPSGEFEIDEDEMHPRFQ